MSREGIQMVVARKTFDGLKEEVKTRKSLCDHFENLNKKNFEENKELKEENKKLKEENEQLEEQLEYDGGRRRRAIGGVHKLFEENKTLKDANLSSLLSERALLKQIKKLKEENKKPDYPSFLRFAYELGGDALFDAIDTAVPNYTDHYTGWSPSKV